MCKQRSICVSFVVEITKSMLWINEMPMSTMLFLNGWSFRLKCHCLCSFSLMFLLNFTHLTWSVHEIWIIFTGFTRPCVSTCTCGCSHKYAWQNTRNGFFPPFLWAMCALMIWKELHFPSLSSTQKFYRIHQFQMITCNCHFLLSTIHKVCYLAPAHNCEK